MIKQKTKKFPNLKQIVSRQSVVDRIKNTNLFSSFSYVDQLTSDAMKIDHKSNNQSGSSSVQSSINFLRNTKKFHLNCFKEKNFKKNPIKKICKSTQDQKSYLGQKKNYRNRKTVDKAEFRKYLIGEKSFLSHELLNKKVKQKSPFLEKKNRLNESYDEVEIKKSKQKNEKLLKVQKKIEEQIIPLMQNHIKFIIHEDNQYLVKPAKFIPKITKQKTKSTEEKSLPNASIIKELKFKEPFETPLLKNLKEAGHKVKQKYQQRLTSGNKDIFQLIRKGEYFGVEIQLSVKKQLMSLKDRKENNLLHICILENQIEIFEMILKKCVENNINLLRSENKYHRNPEELGHLLGFFKRKSTFELIEKCKRYFRFQVATQMYKNFL